MGRYIRAYTVSSATVHEYLAFGGYIHVSFLLKDL